MSLLPVLICLGLCGAVWSAAVKTGSAYTDVTIAIHKDIKEDAALIQSIKNQFTGASRVLYNATGGWAYFKEIVIAVPSTWTPSAYAKIHNDVYEKAEFRVEGPNGQYEDQPYTLQPGGCGEPGEYVHLTPDFLSDKLKSTTLKYGLPDRLIIHEWSHLRYGIFDEYGIPGDPKFPLFYYDEGFMKTSLCSEEVKGYMESTLGSICAVSDEGHVARDCIFIPDMDDETTRASIMSLPYMPTVDRFCTSDDNVQTGHNWKAPTKQNLLCNRRSAWDVVSKHADFSSQRNTGEAFAPPIFKVVRVEPLPPRYVLVLDISSSMIGRPVELMKQSAHFFAKDLIKDGAYIGVVVYNGAASVIQPVTLVNGQAIRGVIQGKIQSIAANGMTSIGSGLLAALQALKSAGVPTEDALLIVLTDGQENAIPNINDALPQVLAAKAKVLGVAFGQSASLHLENLALKSGGKSIMIANIQGSSTADLDQVFVEATTAQADVDVQIVQLLNKPIVLNNAVTETTVTLDHELGKNAVFTLAGQIAQVTMELISPKGQTFTLSHAVASKDAVRIQFKMPTAESGLWKVIFRKTGGGTATVDFGVVSEARNPAEHPVRVKASISGAKVNFGKTNLKVFAQVTKGSNAVIRAKVEALVTSDTQRKIHITLKDDGAGADIIADDGIYTAYFTDFRAGEKRYTVSAQVENRGTAFIKSAKHSASPVLARRTPRVPPTGPPTSTFKLEQFQVVDGDPDAGLPVGDPAANFDRTATGGSFILENFVQKDLIKPSAINDLSVKSTGEAKDGRKFITLTWTAPGDDLDSGTPAHLELRVSLEGNRFVKDFSAGHLLNVSHVLNGTLAPQAGGSKQTVTIYLPKELLENVQKKKSLDVYLSAKATDKAGNVADLGNIAAAHFGYEIPICLQKSGMFPKARACGQFYHCSHGQPYLKDCPGGLHFSVAAMRCEWPCNAKCDSRIVCSSP